MPRLERLVLVYVRLSLHFYTYRSEFDDTRCAWLQQLSGSKPSPFFLPALKSIELHLTRDWFERQFHYAMLPFHDPAITDFEYEDVGGGEREEEKDDMLVHILEHRKDVVTFLDMSPVSQTHYRLPIVDLFAGLTNLRGIDLRVSTEQ